MRYVNTELSCLHQGDATFSFLRMKNGIRVGPKGKETSPGTVL
jgi:hypothetical protein